MSLSGYIFSGTFIEKDNSLVSMGGGKKCHKHGSLYL